MKLLMDTDPVKLTDIQRAARKLYLLKNSYGGLIRNPNYRFSVAQPSGFNPERLPEIIEETHHRLARVQIECLPYEKVLTQYDRVSTLFYLDPPYLVASSTATISILRTFVRWRNCLGESARQIRALTERRS